MEVLVVRDVQFTAFGEFLETGGPGVEAVVEEGDQFVRFELLHLQSTVFQAGTRDVHSLHEPFANRFEFMFAQAEFRQAVVR